MKVCVIADTHIHPFANFSEGVGVENSRVKISLDALDQVRRFCIDTGIHEVIHAGDLFHARDHQRYPIFNAVFDALAKFSESKIHVTLIAGNHDIVDKSGTLTLHSLRSTAGVYSEFKVLSGLKLCLIPYTTDYEELTKNLEGVPSDHCVIGHLDLVGAKVGSANYVVPEGFSPEIFKRFQRVLLGHYHVEQFLTPTLSYIGALTPVDFGEEGQAGGFYVLETLTGKVTRHTVNCPKFVSVDPSIEWGETDLQTFVKGNYVRVLGKHDAIWDSRLKAAGAASWEWRAKVEAVQSTSRIGGIQDMTWPETVQAYVKQQSTSDLDIEKLGSVGMKLLVPQ